MTGKQLKSFRQFRDLTQAELAEKLGIATITIQRNENASKVSKRLKRQMKEYFPDLTAFIYRLSNLTNDAKSVIIK